RPAARPRRADAGRRARGTPRELPGEPRAGAAALRALDRGALARLPAEEVAQPEVAHGEEENGRRDEAAARDARVLEARQDVEGARLAGHGLGQEPAGHVAGHDAVAGIALRV